MLSDDWRHSRLPCALWVVSIIFFMFAIVKFVKITCVYQAIASLSTIVTSTELLGRVMLTSLH